MKKVKKSLKIKWNNIGLSLILLICSGIGIHDIYILTISSWITGNIYGFTWLGLAEFITAFIVGWDVFERIKNNTKRKGLKNSPVKKSLV